MKNVLYAGVAHADIMKKDRLYRGILQEIKSHVHLVISVLNRRKLKSVKSVPMRMAVN